MKVIGIGHRSGSGKTTLAKLLAGHLQPYCGTVVVRGVADEIKALAHAQFGVEGMGDAEYYEHNRNLRTVPLAGMPWTPVELWVKLGNLGRELDPRYWLMKIEEYCEEQEAAVLIIPDVRTLVEMNWIREFGGWVFRCDRPGLELVPGASMDDELAALPATWWDGVVNNAGTIADLDYTAACIAKEVVG